MTLRWRLVALAAVLVAVLPACGRDGWEREACTPSRPKDAGFIQLQLQSGGLDRSAVLYVPSTYDGTEEYPIVFNWHGFGSSADQHVRYADMLELAESDEFFVLAPQGFGYPARFNLGYGITSEADDVQLAVDLIDTVARDYCVDAARVYSTGASNGGGMSALLACRVPDRFAAVGMVALLLFEPSCASPGTPVIGIMGDQDIVVPVDGGTVRCCGTDWTIASASQTMADWAAHDGCTREAVERVKEHVERTVWRGCDGDAEVRWFRVEGGGHTWPGVEGDGLLGHTTGEISASKEMWEFFRRFHR
jgi:polyhydroxybutyrate depolymerase